MRCAALECAGFPGHYTGSTAPRRPGPDSASDWNCLVCYSEPLTGLAGLPSTNHLSVVPQFTLVTSRRDQVKGAANIRENDVKAGVDVKFRPRADTVIDATINPDFLPG